MNFVYSGDSLHPDWTSIKYWLIDPQFALMSSSFLDQHYLCETHVRVSILSGPIPNHP